MALKDVNINYLMVNLTQNLFVVQKMTFQVNFLFLGILIFYFFIRGKKSIFGFISLWKVKLRGHLKSYFF